MSAHPDARRGCQWDFSPRLCSRARQGLQRPVSRPGAGAHLGGGLSANPAPSGAALGTAGPRQTHGNHRRDREHRNVFSEHHSPHPVPGSSRWHGPAQGHVFTPPRVPVLSSASALGRRELETIRSATVQQQGSPGPLPGSTDKSPQDQQSQGGAPDSSDTPGRTHGQAQHRAWDRGSCF